MEKYNQYGKVPFKYINGLGIRNNAESPLTKIDVLDGSCTDSNSEFQLISKEIITIDIMKTGSNGIDTGSVQANKLYCLYIVWSSTDSVIPSLIASLSYDNPVMPSDCDAKRLIGFFSVDNDSNIYQGYWTAGNSGSREFFYLTPTIVVNNEGSTAVTEIDLSSVVPSITPTPIKFGGQLIGLPAFAGILIGITGSEAIQSAYLSQLSSDSPFVIYIDQVISVNNEQGKAAITYQFTAEGPTAILNVASYKFTI